MLAERHAEAVDAFEQYIGSHGSDTSQSGRERVALAVSNLAVLLEEVLGRREEAAVIYRQLLREYPTEALRAADSAAKQASRSLEPADRARRARALFSRASMLRDLGRVEDARQTLQALAREYAGDRAPLVSAIRDSSHRLQADLD